MSGKDLGYRPRDKPIAIYPLTLLWGYNNEREY